MPAPEVIALYLEKRRVSECLWYWIQCTWDCGREIMVQNDARVHRAVRRNPRPRGGCTRCVKAKKTPSFSVCLQNHMSSATRMKVFCCLRSVYLLSSCDWPPFCEWQGDQIWLLLIPGVSIEKKQQLWSYSKLSNYILAPSTFSSHNLNVMK
jgi:hypothetical protein